MLLSIEMYPRPNHDNVQVWQQTQERYKTFPAHESVLYNKPPTDAEVAAIPRHRATQYALVNEDCIHTAVVAKRGGRRPLLLNMADWVHPGGSVDLGAATQEEECFRRSNYYRFLHSKYYPLQVYDTLVSNGVEYYCGKQQDGFPYMDHPDTIDMIAAPALQSPPLTDDRKHFRHHEHVEIMRHKMRLLFWAAYKNGNDALILSAWGCGAFSCPPQQIAEIFKQVCLEFNGVFALVAFAILGPSYPVFQTVLGAEPQKN